MGILDRFRSKKGTELDVLKELTDPAKKLNQALFMQWMGSNVPIYKGDNTQNYVEKGYNYNPLVFSIIQWKAQKAAAVDFTVCETKPGGEKIYYPNHEALDVIYNPNEWQGKQEYFEQLYGFKEIDGNSYVYAPRIEAGINKGKIMEMHVLPATITEIVTGTSFNPIGAYRVNYNGASGQNDFDPSEVMHLRYANYDFDFSSYVYGISPLKAAWRLIQKSNSNIDASKKSFDNMGALGLLYKKFDKEMEELTDTQIKRAQYQLDKKVRGTDNKGRVLWSEGDYGYLNFGANPVDLALIEDAQMTREELCTSFHVQPQIFGSSQGSSNHNMKEYRKLSYVDGVLPLVQSFADEYNRSIMPAYGKNLKLMIVTDNIPELQADRKEQTEWLSKAHWIKENEKREIQGFEPIEGLDINVYPANFLPFGDDFSETDKMKQQRSDYFNKS
jgi:HK97 family phage portal protein